jgi:surface antigen
MALLDEIEPPSHKAPEKTKESKRSSKTKHQFNIYFNQFRTTSLSSLSLRLGIVKAIAINTTKVVRNFVLSNKYLPHCALVGLGALVVFSNFNERVAAEAYYKDFVTTGPDTEYAVASSVDQFTTLIPNGSDLVKKQILAATTTSQDGFVNSSGSFTTQLTSRETPLPDNSTGTVDYVVKSGDTLTALGWKFNVKLATLKYVNNLDNVDSIKPGSKIKIPQKGYEVSAALIAKRDAENKAKLALASRNTVTRNSAGRALASSVRVNPGSSNNGYPYGYCTYYVASRRYVPAQWGDAKNWLNSASRAGYSTGSAPAVGAIVVTKESWWGHVAFVESVDGDSITISEMNAKGWGVVDRRTMSAYGGVVRGYIY